VFVLPSINCAGKTEGLGIVLLEAMASGCPVIGSNVGGIPDIITDGENGFLVPEQRPDIIAEKIIRILADTGLQEKFRRNGLIRVQELFSWEIISKKFSDVYEQVLEKQSGKSAP
jgi:glycosyltransferase involved in cell wall biosynthesis